MEVGPHPNVVSLVAQIWLPACAAGPQRPADGGEPSEVRDWDGRGIALELCSEGDLWSHVHAHAYTLRQYYEAARQVRPRADPVCGDALCCSSTTAHSRLAPSEPVTSSTMPPGLSCSSWKYYRSAKQKRADVNA